MSVHHKEEDTGSKELYSLVSNKWKQDTFITMNQGLSEKQTDHCKKYYKC